MIFGPSAFQLRGKINKKGSPDRSKIKQKIGQHRDPFFDASWKPTWLPRPSQNLHKINQKSMKMGIKINHIFWTQLWANLELSWSNLWATLSQLGPTWNQLWPNMAPKSPLRGALVGPKIVQKSIKNRSWGRLGAQDCFFCPFGGSWVRFVGHKRPTWPQFGSQDEAQIA